MIVYQCVKYSAVQFFFSKPIYAIYEPSALVRSNISVGWNNTLQSPTFNLKSGTKTIHKPLNDTEEKCSAKPMQNPSMNRTQDPGLE